MNRIGLKIVCVVVSIVIWVQVAAISDVEQNAHLPLRVTGLAENVTVAGSILPTNVQVKVRGSKLRLLSHHYFNRFIGEVRVNLADRQPGPAFSYEVTQADIFTDLEVVSIYPPVRLRLRLDDEISQMLSVELHLTGNLKERLGFLERPTVEPDSVLVTGPARFFPPEASVSTSSLDLTRVSENSDVKVDLVAPNQSLVLARKTAQVSLRVAQLEDRTLANIPVIPLVDAGQPDVGISPPLADVMVRGVADSVRALTRSRFSITVPVGDLAEGVYFLPGQVDYPAWLTLIGLDPPEFQVIVGNADDVDVPAEEVVEEGTPGD